MRESDFGPDAPGTLVDIRTPRGEAGFAFLPDELPPDFNMDSEIARKAEQAGIALGNLNGFGHQLPNPWMLINPFVRREALASSRIEGARADFGQLVLFEAEQSSGKEDLDIQEVVNYAHALNSAWDAEKEWLVSTTSVCALHRTLLQGVRGDDMRPGELRDVPIYIGGPVDTLSSARFTPAPHHEIQGLLDNMFGYIEGDDPSPSLVKLAVSHYQFETIHPFRDGNGRLGRMLVPLVLKYWGILDFPMLYLSEYFERQRTTYIDLLYRVSTEGVWKEWIAFFLDAVRFQARDAVERSRLLLDLRESLRSRYQGDRSSNLLPLIDMLFVRPSVTPLNIQNTLHTSKSTANQLVKRLESDGLLREITGQQRYKVFVAEPILRVASGMDSGE